MSHHTQEIGMAKGYYKYTMNRYAFVDLNINTSWILGLIYSDGYIHPGERLFSISSSDLDQMIQINEILESDYPIKQDKRTGVYTLGFGCSITVKQLKLMGLTQNKSKSMAWPQGVPDHLMSHFIRGLWDGDGSFYFDKQKQFGEPRITGKFVCGSRPFIENMFSVIRSEAVPKGGGLYYEPQQDVSRIRFSHKNTIQLANWMYRDSTSLNRLARKYEKVKPFLSV
jgi:hypothetical protein